ncbi:MAG: hypothetical protein ABI651_22080, partial [Verrucomicrobiota bacterium]
MVADNSESDQSRLDSEGGSNKPTLDSQIWDMLEMFGVAGYQRQILTESRCRNLNILHPDQLARLPKPCLQVARGKRCRFVEIDHAHKGQ